MVDSIVKINNINNYNVKSKLQDSQEAQFGNTLDAALKSKDEKKLKDACRQLESVFVNMIIKQMRNSISKSDVSGSSLAEESYEDMLYEKYGEEMTKNKGIGISSMLFKQLSKNLKENSEVVNDK